MSNKIESDIRRYTILGKPNREGNRPVTIFKNDPTQTVGSVPGIEVGTLRRGLNIFVPILNLNLSKKQHEAIRLDIQTALDFEAQS
jgi:hypothetical protein